MSRILYQNFCVLDFNSVSGHKQISKELFSKFFDCSIKFKVKNIIRDEENVITLLTVSYLSVNGLLSSN